MGCPTCLLLRGRPRSRRPRTNAASRPLRSRGRRVQIRYYVFAILFLIFDVEAVFLFPWAIVFLNAVPAVFYEMLIFIGILFFGVIYGWRKGVLQWR